MKIAALLLFVSTSFSATAGSASSGSARPLAPSPPAAKVVVSGVDDGAILRELPPVLVELGHLPRRSAVWVELYRGPARDGARGVTIDSQFLRRNEKAILSVMGLSPACAGAGTWTMLVMVSTSLETQVVAERTFTLGRR